MPQRDTQRAPWEIATDLDLVPTPREIRLAGGSLPLSGWDLATAGAYADGAAEAVTRRLRALGAIPMQRVEAPGARPCILAVPCTHRLAEPFLGTLDVSPERPGPQGYVIHTGERGGTPVALALGCDDLGALYAAETLAQLIRPGHDGMPVLLRATVRDHPAFLRRCIGHLGAGGAARGGKAGDDPARRYLETVRSQLEWLARHKINYTLVGAVPGNADERVEMLRRVADLAARYGIRLRRTFGTAIDDELAPGAWTGCVTRGASRFCWSAAEEHGRRARRLAREAAATRLGLFCLHVIDAGGLADPECWSRRCARCRSVYGDDYVRAGADLILTYYRALKEEAPECEFEAVVYPYHYQWALPGFASGDAGFDARLPGEGFAAGLSSPGARRDARARLERDFQALAALLPEDVLITFREAGRAELDAAGALWGEHPVTAWVYFSRNHGWQGLWEPQQRYLKTWHRGHPRDFFLHAGLAYAGNLVEPRAAGCAEYAWNPDVPDAEATFGVQHRFYRTGGRDVTPYQRESLIPRVLRRLWGAAWELFLPLFGQNASLAYAADPLGTTNAHQDGEALDDPYLYLQAQADLFREAYGRLERYVAERMAAGRHVPGPAGGRGNAPAGDRGGANTFISCSLSRAAALYLYRLVAAASAKLEVAEAIAQALGVARAGDAREAERLLASLGERLAALEERVTRAAALAQRELPHLECRSAGAAQDTESILLRYRPAAERRRVERALAAVRAGAPGEPLRRFLADEPAAVPLRTDPPHLRAIGIDWADRSEQTVTYGYATLIRVAPYVDGAHLSAGATRRPTGAAGTLAVEVQRGDTPLAHREVPVALPGAAGLWRPERPVEFNLGLAYEETLRVRLTLETENGRRDQLDVYLSSSSRR